MNVTEAATRLLPRYWLVVALAIAAPMTAVGAYVAHSPDTYTARTRLLAAPTVPQAQAQADAVVSQVQAVATSRDLVTTALTRAGVHRDPAAVIKSITVAGVGSSGLVDLSYTDTTAANAQRVDAALANLVVTRLLVLRAGVPELVQNLDSLIAALGADRAVVAATPHAVPHTATLLTSIDDLVGDMIADRTRLSAFGQAGASVAIVDAATLPAVDGTGLVAKLAIALLLGLVLGLLIVGTNETLRPRVAGGGGVARLLDAPMLGRVGSDLAAMAHIGRRMRLASRREWITSVVLMRADGTPVAPELVGRLRVITLDTMPMQWSTDLPPADAALSDGSPSQNGASAGGRADDGPDDDGITAVAAADPMTASTTLTMTAPQPRRPAEARPRHVVSIDDLDTGSESERIGLIVIAGRTTRIRAIGDVRDLVAATGWPILGVLDDPQNRSGMR